jgi:ligand-binding sensor domain-containing protein
VTIAVRRGLLCLLLSVLGVSPVWAVDPNRHISQYAHNSWTNQDGFLPGMANAIAQTADGYLWVGTSAGLVRFDGIRFIPWDAPGEPLAVSSSEITALLTTRDGSIWIAARISPTRQNLSHWTGQQWVNIPVESTGIWSILESRSGAVWIARPFCEVVGSGLHCHRRADGTPFDHGDSVAEDTAGNVWVGSDIDQVRWKSGSFSIYAPSGLESNGAMEGVAALAAAGDGSVWAGMRPRGPGLGLQHLVQGQWKSWVASGFDSSDLSVAALLMDRQGALWIGTPDQGIYRIYRDKVEHFRSADGLSSDNVYNLYEDREGNIWAATQRERQVMELVVRGWLNKHVGRELGISEITVKAHRGRMMQKMNAASLADLVKMAVTLPQKFSNSWSRKSIVFDGTARLAGDLEMPRMNAGFKRRIG